MKAAVCVLVTIEADVRPGNVTANFGFFVSAIVVVDGSMVVVVFTVTVTILVVVLVDPSTVTVEVIASVALVVALEGT